MPIPSRPQGRGRGGLKRADVVAVLATALLRRIQSCSAWTPAAFTPGPRALYVKPTTAAAQSLAITQGSSSGGDGQVPATRRETGVFMGFSFSKMHRRNSSNTRSKTKKTNKTKKAWGAGVWQKLTGYPTSGRAHDEVTFRSGCEGRTLTIPQGKWGDQSETCDAVCHQQASKLECKAQNKVL